MEQTKMKKKKKQIASKNELYENDADEEENEMNHSFSSLSITDSFCEYPNGAQPNNAIYKTICGCLQLAMKDFGMSIHYL